MNDWAGDVAQNPNSELDDAIPVWGHWRGALRHFALDPDGWESTDGWIDVGWMAGDVAQLGLGGEEAGGEPGEPLGATEGEGIPGAGEPPAGGAEPPAGSAPEGEVPGDWKGPTDYSSVKNPKDIVNNTKPTPRQVREMKKLNREHNGGVLRDDVTGEPMVDSAKSTRGVTPPQNEAQVDHIDPVSRGGTRSSDNPQLRTRKNNRDKWDNLPGE